MDIDVLGGLPNNSIAKENKNTQELDSKTGQEKKQNNNNGCRAPFTDDGEENLPECSPQSHVARLYTTMTSCPELC